MSAISWFRLPRGRVWHVALGGRALCGEWIPQRGGEWLPSLPPFGARVCSACNDVDERVGHAIAEAMGRADVPLPVGDDDLVDAEIVDDDPIGVRGLVHQLAENLESFDGVHVVNEARLISFGPTTGESPFPFAGVAVVNGSLSGEYTLEDPDGLLAAAIAERDRGGTLEAGFDADGDEIVYDPDGDPDRSVPEGGPAVVDLVAALRSSVEAAKARREGRADT